MPEPEVTPGAQPVAPAQAQPTQQTPPQPQTPSAVTVPYSDFQALMALPAQLAQFRADQEAAKRAADASVADALLKKGEAENAVKTVRDQWGNEVSTLKAEKAELENASKAYAVNTAVAQALAGHNLLPGVAAEIMQLIAPALQAERKGGTFDVRTATFQSAEDYVKEWIAARPHYQPSRSQGGVPSQGGNVPAPSGGQGQPGDLVQPSTEGQKAYAEWLLQQQQLKQAGYGGIGFGTTSRATGVGPAIPAPTGVAFGRN